MKANNHSIKKWLVVSSAVGMVSAVQADILTNPSDIAAFKVGATVENFDDLPAVTIPDYNSSVDVTGKTFSSRDPKTSPTFDSGGASPKDPVGNPGTPIGILNPAGSANNVATGILMSAPTALDPGSFMEVAFPRTDIAPAGTLTDALKVGFLVTHGTVDVRIDRVVNDVLESDSLGSVSEGQFFALTHATADIRNIGLTPGVQGGVFAIDDFTYAFSATSTDTTTTPDGGHMVSLAMSVVCMGLANWRLRKQKR